MSVTVDHEEMACTDLGLTTVGHVLTRLQRDNRLVVSLLIDGQQPDLRRAGQLRAAPLAGHTLFIETVEPQAIALEVLDEVDAQLADADRLKADAIDLLQRGTPAPAMERLSGCFTVWNAARESLEKTTQLLRIDVEAVRVGTRTLADLLLDFTDQLKQIKASL
ncbi:MAG: hypothetical protein JWO31_372, partial [Phycisphaerales bacterium]|nr:hypothetical protein [Phycisphaerales bacterium]